MFTTLRFMLWLMQASFFKIFLCWHVSRYMKYFCFFLRKTLRSHPHWPSTAHLLSGRSLSLLRVHLQRKPDWASSFSPQPIRRDINHRPLVLCGSTYVALGDGRQVTGPARSQDLAIPHSPPPRIPAPSPIFRFFLFHLCSEFFRLRGDLQLSCTFP